MALKPKRTLLHDAVTEEKIDVISRLISQNVDVNVKDDKTNTPLHLAVETRNLSIIKLLLNAGADVHAKNGELKEYIEPENTPLRMAIKSNNIVIIKCFMDAIGSVNAKDDKGCSMLQLAASWGNSKTVKLLLDAGADVRSKDIFGRTPLFWACESTNNTDILKLLIDAGSDVNVKDEDNMTPLHCAAKSENTSLIQMLLEAGGDVDVNAKDDHNESTPVHQAAAWGDPGVFKLLIAAGGDIEALDEIGNTPLLRAMGTKNVKVVETIVESGANVNAANLAGVTALHHAASFGDAKIVRLLIEAGAHVNARENSKSLTPLYYAANAGNAKILQLLILSGARVNVCDLNRETPLGRFVYTLSKRKKVIDENVIMKSLKLLIDGTDVNLLHITGKNTFSDLLKADHFVPVRKFFYKPALKHTAILESMNSPVDSSLLEVIYSNENDYKNFYTTCREELDKAKSTKIQHCWVTFFNLLIDGQRKLVRYAGNADLIKDFVRCMNDFPIYGADMQSNLSQGISGRDTFDSAANMLSYHLPIFNSSHLIIKDVLDILGEKDWKKLGEKKRILEN